MHCCYLYLFVSAAAAAAVAFILSSVNDQHLSAPTRDATSRVQPSAHPFSSNDARSSKSKNGTMTAAASWDEAKSCLCPKSAPQPTKYGRTLFELARYELGIQRSNRKEEEEEEFVDTFFRYSPALSAYYKPPNGPISVIYVGNKKAASTQIKDHFRSIGLERDEGVHADVSSLNLTRTVAPDACVITAVRDPIERFLSGYSELEHRTVTKAHYRGTVDKLPVRYKKYQNGETRRFEQLVKDFLSHPGFLSARGDGGEGETQSYDSLLRHLWGQTRILTHLDDMGLSLTSYLPSIANITFEWEKFVTDNCPSAVEYIGSRGPRAMKLEGQHHSSKDIFNFRHAANSVWAEGGSTARALCALHAMDYACFDRLPNGVNEVCAEVYSGRHFLDEIGKGCT